MTRAMRPVGLLIVLACITFDDFKFHAAKVTLFPDITRKSPEKLSVCLSKSKNDSSVGREERRAEPSAVALGAALIGSQHEKCLYSQQSDSVTNLFAWLVQEIRLNGNPPERRPAFEGPAAFLTGEW
jgi:hypothetical protein